MPGRVVQYQVKLAAMNLFERDILPLHDILEICGFSESTFWRMRKLWRETGWVEKPRSCIRGRRRILHRDDLDYIINLVNLRPDWFLDEILTLLKHNRFISVHFTTIFRELERLGMSRKKLKKITAECNENVRNDYVRRISEYPAEYLGFLDETSKNDRTLSRGYGRAKKGCRTRKKEKFVRGTRLTATGLLTVDGMMANTVVEGSMKRADYLEFIEHEVMRQPRMPYALRYSVDHSLLLLALFNYSFLSAGIQFAHKMHYMKMRQWCTEHMPFFWA
ncbi:hypothetical protein B0H19DRAFT_1324112 [Mycena capillaripes]|nr:hypothetical protein B0H19DRAFT_1324112 [Mycena capillaripes]